MKLSLVVRSPGKSEGKLIPITLSQFVIGRDPQCHLRPASAAISKRHCALLVRGDKAFVRDFDSTNGTFINEEQVQGERELHDADKLQVGPLFFDVKLEASVTATPPPPAAKTPAQAAAPDDDEAVAAMLLSLQDDPTAAAGSPGVDSQGIPTGSTVMDIMSVPTENTKEEESAKAGTKRADAAKAAQGNTSSAAKAILEKYMRRPRT
jgi:pSer/pThr/pTyr-binding forkhead associated (FHA) protein